MDEKIFEKLCKSPEGTNLDFKKEWYHMYDKQDKKAAEISFVKDVISMANSSIYDDAYIICGIEDSGKRVGINKLLRIPDDADLQQRLKKYTSSPVKFELEDFINDEMRFVVIKIQKTQNRPIFCTKQEETKLQEGCIYCRNGSSNSIVCDKTSLDEMYLANREDYKEELIYTKSDVQFEKYISEFLHRKYSNKENCEISKIIEGEYYPFNVFEECISTFSENRILPLAVDLLNFEGELRKEYSCPFTRKRINNIREKLFQFIDNEWASMISESYNATIKHLRRFLNIGYQYKIQEIRDREEYISEDVKNKIQKKIIRILDQKYVDVNEEYM